MAGHRSKRKRAETTDEQQPNSSSSTSAAPQPRRRRSEAATGNEPAAAADSGTTPTGTAASGTVREKNINNKNEKTTTTSAASRTTPPPSAAAGSSPGKKIDLKEVPIPKKKEYSARKAAAAQQQQQQQQEGSSPENNNKKASYSAAGSISSFKAASSSTTSPAGEQTSQQGNDHVGGGGGGGGDGDSSTTRAAGQQTKMTSLVEQNKQKQFDKDIKIPKKKSVLAEKRASGKGSRAPTPSKSVAPPAGGADETTTASGTTRKQQKQANQSAAAAAAAAAAAPTPTRMQRQAKMQSLLEHRKVLLQRVRKGRAAAQTRLDTIHQSDPAKLTETPEQEIAAFKEMSKLAASTARKQSRSDSEVLGANAASAAGGRTSVSLRRGSSVGKRMNAALSSLAPSTAATDGAAASAAAGTAAVGAAGTGVAAGNTGVPKPKAAILTGAGASVGKATKTQIPQSQKKRPSSTPAAISSKAAAAAAAAMPSAGVVGVGPSVIPSKSAGAVGRFSSKKGVSISSDTSSMQPPAAVQYAASRPAVASKSMKKSAASGAPSRASSVTSGSNKAGRLAANAAAGSAGSSMAHRLQHQQHVAPPVVMPPPKPSVVCPEAVALREHKKAVVGKLTALFQTRLQQQQEQLRRDSNALMIQRTPSTSSSPGRESIFSSLGVSSAGAASQAPSKVDIPSKVLEQAIKGPGEPSRLPKRRRTHWDYVLQEMRWLATDFIEERKWKVSTSRVIAESAKTQDRVTVTKIRGTPEPSSKKGTSKDGSEKDATALSGDEAAASNSSADKKDGRTETIRTFVEPTESDVAESRSVSRILSSMVIELSTAIESAGVSSSGEADELSKALQRHQLARKRLEGDESSSDDMLIETNDARASAKHGDSDLNQSEPSQEGIETVSDSFTGSESNITREGSEREKIFRRVSVYVDGALKKANDAPTSKSKGSKLPGLSTLASAGQIRAIERIEDFWTRTGTGTVLGGSLASGKTIVSCALIWKNRSGGPQLVICSRLNMVRWMHELGRFEELRLCPVATEAGISSPFPAPANGKEYKESDVVLCDFAASGKLSKATFAKFQSIVVDTRYPRAFFGSRQPVCSEHEALMTKNIASTEMPSELASSTWWSHLANATASSQSKRLIIDSSPPRDTLQFLIGIPDRQLLEVLGLRLAFMLGATNFLGLGHYSLGKCVLAWARRRIKDSEDDVKGTKFQRVRGLFLDLADSFYCEIEGGKHLEDVAFQGSSHFAWELRMCDMPELQRSAYDKACRESRAALSVALAPLLSQTTLQSDPFVSVASVLLRLRRLCIHSNCNGVLSKACARGGNRSSPWCFHKKVGCGSTQPDADLAATIMEGSGKMTELLSILVNECDIKIANMEFLAGFLTKATSRKSSSKGRQKKGEDHTKRVAILASLPEAQVLVSLLLNSVGVDHEVLFRPELTDSATGVGTCTDALHVHPIAWVNGQLILSRFNEETTDASLEHGSIRVLIGSLDTVAGDHHGLGIESADVVVCVDEDWSGRTELQMMSLGVRCLSRWESSKGDACRFIKLAAAESCEEMFISSGGHDNAGKRRAHRKAQKSGKWPWPLEANGSFSVPEKVMSSDTELRKSWTGKEPAPGMFAFPACNIMVLRNTDLAEVLSPAEPLPPLLYSQSDTLFLPTSDEDGEDIEVEMNLVSRLARHELSALYSIPWQIDDENDTTVAINTMSRPQALDFPGNLVGRRDLAVLPSRLYLQRTLREISRWKLAVTGDSVAATTLPADLINGALASDAPEDADRLAGDGLKAKPNEIASTLLFYEADRQSDGGNGSARRTNAYSSVFCRLKCAPVANDGNSGYEPLVYFPPLFPRLLECSELARLGVETLRAHRLAENDAATKRISDGSEPANAKRQKLEGDNIADEADDASERQMLVPQKKPSNEARLITEDEASHSDAASVLFDLSDDFGLAGIGAVPLPRDSALSAANSSVLVDQDTGTYGGAGVWYSSSRYPADAEEAQVARLQPSRDLNSMVLFVTRKRTRGFAGFAGQVAYPFTAGMQLSAGASGTLSGSFTATELYPDVNGTGRKTKKKPANQKDSSVGVSAFSRLPTTDPRLMGAAQLGKVREINRHRASSAVARYTGKANTLFEAPLFRAASLRVRTNVAERFERHGWTSGHIFEAGPGLPLLVSKQPAAFPPYQGLLQVDPSLWTSLVKRLKTKASSTGDEALELSAAQQLALRRSSVAPCRVDFGPFQAGFLSSPSGMTAVPPPRARMGISLPMGVKIPAYKEQIPSDWSPEDDRQLQRTVEQFGMNWVLVARAMSGFHDVTSSWPRDRHSSSVPRSARACRERWQGLALAQSLPAALEERKLQDSAQLKNAMDVDEVSDEKLKGERRRAVGNATGMNTLLIDQSGKIDFLLPSSMDNNDVDTEKPKPTTASKDAPQSQSQSPDQSASKEEEKPEATKVLKPKPKRVFNAIRSAMTKKQVVPITIPGVTTGSPPTVVPSHPSHMQSVQSSVAAAWTNGRTEMWPLQLLEASDRHRASLAAASAPVVATLPVSVVAAASSARPHSSSSIRSSSSKPPPASAVPMHGRPPGGGSVASYPAVAQSSSRGSVAAGAVASRPSASQPSGSSTGGRNSSVQTFKPPPAKAKPKPAVTAAAAAKSTAAKPPPQPARRSPQPPSAPSASTATSAKPLSAAAQSRQQLPPPTAAAKTTAAQSSSSPPSKVDPPPSSKSPPPPSTSSSASPPSKSAPSK